MVHTRWRDKGLDPDRALEAMLDPWHMADLPLPMFFTRQGCQFPPYWGLPRDTELHLLPFSLWFPIWGDEVCLRYCTDQTLAALRLSYMIILLLPAPLWDSQSSHICNSLLNSLHLLCCTLCFMGYSGWHEDATQLGWPSLFSWRRTVPSKMLELVKC